MTIVYISHLDGSVANGLSWSVPASVKAQENIDKVLWLNTSEAELPHWKESKSFTKSPRLKNLEGIRAPFNHPDVVVFEGFYDDLYDVFLGHWLKKNNIPYIIIPRSALTIHAMNNHAKLKKRIAHWLFYDRFIKEALAIQYLTARECNETKVLFDNDGFIIPNGINQQTQKKMSFNKDSVKGLFIGRLDMHQKGLDVLLDTIEVNKALLEDNGFRLDVYGPENQDYFKVDKIVKDKGLNNIVYLKGETRGLEKEKALLDADVFFLTSRFEGHPMGLIEALSYGLPCFVTLGSNMGNEVRDAKCGWVAEFSKDDISAKLKQMIEEKDSFATYGGRAIELSKRYEWSKLAEAFHNEIAERINKQ